MNASEFRPIWVCTIIALGAILGCDETKPEPEASTTDTASSSASDSGTADSTDTCPDTGCDPGLPCIREVRGRIVFDDGTPMQGPVPICTPNCVVVDSDQYGNFVRSLGPTCKTFDFSVDEGIHVTVMHGVGEYAMYSGSFEPEAEELDNGTLDVGTLTLYALPEPVASYTEAEGAEVDASGMRFTLPPASLVEGGYEDGAPVTTPVASAQIHVFVPSLETWQPPFNTHVGAEALYFVGPYFALLEAPVTFEIDVPQDWTDGTSVEVYMLGEYLSEWGGMSDYFYHGEDGTCVASGELESFITVGEFASCGVSVVQGGVLTTPPMPRLGWYGLKRQ